jgi:tetratricopeptide (TPR) repeat protein
MAQKRREEAARAAFDAASVVDEHERGRNKKRRGVDDAVPDLPAARRQLDEHLRKKRGAEAGALLQRLAQQLGGREIADLALDSGDRCRALGQSRSATNCYLAAWRADPLYETPLWRLSDVCLNDQEIDLAVGYLERIAELMRSRGDDEGAIGVYRKIAMIAPERQDVRDVIRLAKTTGRLDG